MHDNEYAEHMRTLNKKQYELCIHVMQQLEEEVEPMHIFIEGGGGVAKTCLGRALMETITRYYRKQVGQNYEHEVILTVAPTGMTAFQIKGTIAHSGLHIPINQNKLSNPSHSERNNLYKQYCDMKVVFTDEISMVGCHICNKIDQHLQDMFGCKKVFGCCHVVAVGDLYQMKPVKRYIKCLKMQIVDILQLEQILGQITLKSSHR